MASSIKCEHEAAASKDDDKESMAADMQSYLLSNYRDALKKGDKGAAKSCLLAARCFAERDPNVASEIYNMAKLDGDISEASKSFAEIFNHLIESSKVTSTPKVDPSNSSSIIDRMKDELSNLLCELESFHIKFKSPPTPFAHLNKYIFLSFNREDKRKNKDSALKANNNPSNRIFSYKVLFDSLPDETKRAVFDYAIENYVDAFEKIRLMMLEISVFPEDAADRGSHLLKMLTSYTDLRDKYDKQSKIEMSDTTYLLKKSTKALLVLDAIPLVLRTTPLLHPAINLETLFERTLSFSSDHWLEEAARECKLSELQSEVKSFIAGRILGSECDSASATAAEKHSRATSDLLSEKYLATITRPEIKIQLEKLKSIVTEGDSFEPRFDQIIKIIDELNLSEDNETVGANKASAQTTPTKGRGRPKKTLLPAIVGGLDGNVKTFVFFCIMRYMFMNFVKYLRGTRSRVIINFDNPLVDATACEADKDSSHQRTSRSKTGSQQANELPTRPLKKIKLESSPKATISNSNANASPLISEASRSLDLQIIEHLSEAYKCSSFLGIGFDKYFGTFIDNNHLYDLIWLQRLFIDGNMITRKYENVSYMIEQYSTKRISKQEKSGASSRSVDVTNLRNLVQHISCHLLASAKNKALSKMSELFEIFNDNNLLKDNREYLSGGIMEEHKLIAPYNDQANLGFLFFDPISLLRYCVEILMGILKKSLANDNLISDSLLGHAIVLCQFDWPKEFRTYQECLDRLRDLKPKSTTPQCLSAATKFTYPEFFQYIRNPTMIEDFMAMLNQGYTLDIKGSSTNAQLSNASSLQTRNGNGNSNTTSRSATAGPSSRGNKVITTRGVNKTFKEDLKVAFVSQMKISSYMVPLDLISQFIQTSLLPYLNTVGK